ncbi:MAG: DUF4197 domain-containing protein [Bacteroidetes bacterium]|nr:DUF4197 domain-containing protein [Bacteroidota bacterium]
MKKYIKYILIIPVFYFTVSISASQIKNPLKKVTSFFRGGSLTEDEIISGLKAALEKGITTSSEQASRVDGYYGNSLIRIPFPPEAKEAETRLRSIGMSDEVDKFIISLNRGAEKAAKEASSVFVSAIKSMTVEDAWGILKGENDAATKYLNKTTSPQLNAKFLPIISNALDEVSATRYYANLINVYNKIPFVKKLNPDLDTYATEQAIKGLFVLIAKEEARIREDPAARTSEILKKVFGH